MVPVRFAGDTGILHFLEHSTSNYSVRHLFTGQQWYGELGLYDLRNRFYSPDIGRFLQPDPIWFNGDPTNLYRYCGNNPVNHSDPNGENIGVYIIVGLIITAIIIEAYRFSSHPTTYTALQYPETPTPPPQPAAVGPNGVPIETIAAPPPTAPPSGEMIAPAPPDQYISAPTPTPEAPPPDDDFELNINYTSSSDNDATGAKLSDRPSYNPTDVFSPSNLGYTGPTSGLGFIGDYFDFCSGGWSGGGGGNWGNTNAWGAYTNPMGSIGIFTGNPSGGYNVGAGEIINAFTEGGLKPKDL